VCVSTCAYARNLNDGQGDRQKTEDGRTEISEWYALLPC